MIYRKEANFPYPVLSSTSTSYTANYFDLDIGISENVDHYHFQIDYEIGSPYINHLLNTERAQLIFVIQTKDNKFYRLTATQRLIKIPKSRIALNSRTSIQLHIQALDDINFANNDDLSDFYHQLREEITISRYSLLGYSDVVVFDGSIKEPFKLFEKKVDETLKSDIKVELGLEMIIIHYRKPEFQFSHLPKSNSLNNPYIYTGLTKALQSFIINNGEDGEVDLESLDEPESALDLKLYNLMQRKMVMELNYENIDQVIHTISDHIIEKYTTALGELVNHGT
jgi:hypothetical protein